MSNAERSYRVALYNGDGELVGWHNLPAASAADAIRKIREDGIAWGMVHKGVEGIEETWPAPLPDDWCAIAKEEWSKPATDWASVAMRVAMRKGKRP